MSLAAAIIGGPVGIIITITLSAAFLALVGLIIYRAGKRQATPDLKTRRLILEARHLVAGLLHPISITEFSILTEEDRHHLVEWLERANKETNNP